MMKRSQLKLPDSRDARAGGTHKNPGRGKGFDLLGRGGGGVIGVRLSGKE